MVRKVGHYFLSQLHQILTDYQNSFTGTLQARQDGERGEVFPGSATFDGAPPSLKILKRVFQMASF